MVSMENVVNGLPELLGIADIAGNEIGVEILFGLFYSCVVCIK